jgi:hypothetical protein
MRAGQGVTFESDGALFKVVHFGGENEVAFGQAAG